MQATGARDLCAGFGSLSTSYASQHVSRRTCVACTCHGSCLPCSDSQYAHDLHGTTRLLGACCKSCLFGVLLSMLSWPARPQRCNSLLCTCYGVFCARPLPADGRAQGRVLAVISCISAHNACAQRLHATSGPLGLYGDHQRRQCQSTEFREWYNEHAKVAFRVKPCVHSPTSYSNMPLKQFSWITIATHACSKHGNVRGVLFLPKKHS